MGLHHPLFHITASAPAATDLVPAVFGDGDLHVQERRRRSGLAEADAAAPDHRQDALARGRPRELRVNVAGTVQRAPRTSVSERAEVTTMSSCQGPFVNDVRPHWERL